MFQAEIARALALEPAHLVSLLDELERVDWFAIPILPTVDGILSR